MAVGRGREGGDGIEEGREQWWRKECNNSQRTEQVYRKNDVKKEVRVSSARSLLLADVLFCFVFFFLVYFSSSFVLVVDLKVSLLQAVVLISLSRTNLLLFQIVVVLW